MVFFNTDGAVENERKICEVIKKQLENKGLELAPRINTFGIGIASHYYSLLLLYILILFF